MLFEVISNVLYYHVFADFVVRVELTQIYELGERGIWLMFLCFNNLFLQLHLEAVVIVNV